MIKRLVAIALISTYVCSGNMASSAPVSQLVSDPRLSVGLQSEGHQDSPTVILPGVRTPNHGFPVRLEGQVDGHLYKVRDDHPAHNKDAGPGHVPKTGGEKESRGQLQQQLLAKQKEITILHGKMAAATDSLSIEKLRAGTLELQVTQQEQELRALRSRGQGPDQVSRDLVMTRSSLDQAKQKIVDLERQLATSNLEYARQRISELDRQLDLKDKEIRAMRTDSESKERLKDDLAVRTEELKQANQHNLALEHQHIQAKESLDKANRRVSDLETQLTTRSAELEHAKQEIASLKQSEATKQEASLSHKPVVVDKNQPHPAVIESGEPAASKGPPSLVPSGELETSGSDLARLRKDLANEFRRELDSGSVSLWQLGNKLSLELATDELFVPDQVVVTRQGSSLFRRIGTVLKKFRYQTVEVTGHTDTTAIQNDPGKTIQDNNRLSRARAQQASRALISGGVQADRVTAIGYAATKPIATNETEEGRSRNRRIEVIITQWSEPGSDSGDSTTPGSKRQQMFPIHKAVHK